MEQIQQFKPHMLVREPIRTVDGKISHKKYQLLEEIGGGSFSKCWKVRPVGSDNILALKIIPKKSMKILEQQKLVQQVKVHQSLTHPHIVYLDHCFEDSDNQYIFLEYCENKVKKSHTHTVPDSRLQMKKHLKLSNFFLDHNDDIKLGDFGFACKLQYDEELKRESCGTPNFISPEVAGGFGYSYPADVWAFGIILFRLKYGRCPFESGSLKQTIRLIKTCKYTFSKRVETSPELKDLIEKILVIDYDQRYTIEQIENHPFFAVSENSPTQKLKGRQAESRPKSGFKEMITKFFSPSHKKSESTTMAKVDSCKNFKQIKKILKQKTSDNPSSAQDATTMLKNYMPNSTSNSFKTIVMTEQDEKTHYPKINDVKTLYRAMPPTSKAAGVLGNKQTTESKVQTKLSLKDQKIVSITQFYPFFLPYEVDVQNEYILIYLTNGLRQILKGAEPYIVLNPDLIYDRNGKLLPQPPKIIDYIARENLKESKFRMAENSFRDNLSRKNFVVSWRLIASDDTSVCPNQLILYLAGGTVLTTLVPKLLFIRGEYCDHLYNDKLQIVANQAVHGSCRKILQANSLGRAKSKSHFRAKLLQ